MGMHLLEPDVSRSLFFLFRPLCPFEARAAQRQETSVVDCLGTLLHTFPAFKALWRKGRGTEGLESSTSKPKQLYCVLFFLSVSRYRPKYCVQRCCHDCNHSRP